MSIGIDISSLHESDKITLGKDLIIQYNDTKYGKKSDIHCFNTFDNILYIPFSYYKKKWTHIPAIKKTFSKAQSKFELELRDSQKVVKKEAIDYLNNDRCCLLALHCGFGKCFGYNTDILMYDHTIKKVQELEVGDKLIGDDGGIRNIRYLSYGIDKNMYTIHIPELSETVTVNRDHVLCLKIPDVEIVEDIFLKIFDVDTCSFKLLDIDDPSITEHKDIVEISVKDFIEKDLQKHNFYLYKSKVEYPEKEIIYDPFLIGLIKSSKKNYFALELINYLNKDTLNFLIIKDKMFEIIPEVYTHIFTNMEDTEIYYNSYRIRHRFCKGLLSYHMNNIERYYPLLNISGFSVVRDAYGKLEINISKDRYKFKIAQNIDRIYFGFSIDGNGRFILPNGIVSHNTYTSIYLSCKIKLKTMILVHRIILVDQWIDSISKATPSSKTQIITSTNKIDPDSDFYIMNTINVPKRDRHDFDDIGILIVDECLHGETLIKTDTTMKEIKHILIGDNVMSYNHDTDSFEYKPVTNVWCHEKNRKTCFEISVNISHDYIARLKCTEDHLILVYNDVDYVYIPAKNISKGDCIITSFGLRYVVGVCEINIIDTVYDIEVSDNHNFIAGDIIVHNCHTIATQCFSKAMSYFTPRYCIGLSATPQRSDGMDKILNLHFSENYIVRKLSKPHKVYLLRTEYKPVIEYNYNQTINWNKVIESQTSNNSRNDDIVKMIMSLKDRNILVLCKRVCQSNYLYDRLKESDEDVDIFIASHKKFNYKSRVLISTYSKTGVGFDHPKLDTLIIASDVEEMIGQYHGRVLRREDVEPIVIDIVDDMKIFENHWRTRRSYYKSCGAKILKYSDLM